MSKIWFIGDTHLGHQRTLELSKRPFQSVEMMDQKIIENWNDVVGDDDIVYHIGDFGDYHQSFHLKGKIHLLLGNYERSDIEKRMITLSDLREKFNFASVSDEKRIEITANGNVFDLVHEPSHRDINRFTLFGHIHKLQMVKRNALNVGVDCHHFQPIDLDTVLFYITAIEKFYDEEVFMS